MREDLRTEENSQSVYQKSDTQFWTREIGRSDASLRDTPWAGTRTSGNQYKQPAGIGWRTHTENGDVRDETPLLGVGTEQETNHTRAAKARPSEQKTSHRPKSVINQCTFCGPLERMGGVVVDARNPLPVAVGK